MPQMNNTSNFFEKSRDPLYLLLTQPKFIKAPIRKKKRRKEAIIKNIDSVYKLKVKNNQQNSL